MVRCEVLQDTVLAIKKGSVVLVDERQFELARRILKPVADKPKETKKKTKEE